MATKTPVRSQRNGRGEVLQDPANDALRLIAETLPYSVEFTLEGVCPLMFHRWSNEAVAAKAGAAKGSAAKKTDDVESYVYRDEDGSICLPGEYIRAAICAPQGAAKFRQDPRSPRKSALDLYRAAVVPLTILAPICDAEGVPAKEWDYLDARRVLVQRNAVTRQRPSFNAGWRATFIFQIGLPEYVPASEFLSTLSLAGRVVGTAEMRPTYGRFQVIRYEVL